MATVEQEENKQAQELIKKTRLLQTRKNRQISFNAIVLSVYGWHLSIPVLFGILIGHFLDKHVPIPPISWTLNCILIGFVIGFINASRWTKRVGVQENMTQKNAERTIRLKHTPHPKNTKDNL